MFFFAVVFVVFAGVVPKAAAAIRSAPERYDTSVFRGTTNLPGPSPHDACAGHLMAVYRTLENGVSDRSRVTAIDTFPGWALVVHVSDDGGFRFVVAVDTVREVAHEVAVLRDSPLFSAVFSPVRGSDSPAVLIFIENRVREFRLSALNAGRFTLRRAMTLSNPGGLTGIFQLRRLGRRFFLAVYRNGLMVIDQKTLQRVHTTRDGTRDWPHHHKVFQPPDSSTPPVRLYAQAAVAEDESILIPLDKPGAIAFTRLRVGADGALYRVGPKVRTVWSSGRWLAASPDGHWGLAIGMFPPGDYDYLESAKEEKLMVFDTDDGTVVQAVSMPALAPGARLTGAVVSNRGAVALATSVWPSPYKLGGLADIGPVKIPRKGDTGRLGMPPQTLELPVKARSCAYLYVATPDGEDFLPMGEDFTREHGGITHLDLRSNKLRVGFVDGTAAVVRFP